MVFVGVERHRLLVARRKLVVQPGMGKIPPRHLIYFADPMCSWCWGFSTVIDHIFDSFSDMLPLRLVMGGLRPGVSEPMSDEDKVRTRIHWEQVEAASGQTFNFDFFQRSTFVNNTEPACRAVVAARRLDNDKAVSMFKGLQTAFYKDNRDITDPKELASIATCQGFDLDTFSTEFEDIDTMDDTRADFSFCQNSGINSFPTLVAVQKNQFQAVTIGFRPWEEVGPALEKWLGSSNC